MSIYYSNYVWTDNCLTCGVVRNKTIKPLVANHEVQLLTVYKSYNINTN